MSFTQRSIQAPSEFLPEDEEDETAIERLIGVTEMFPEVVRKVVGKTAQMTYNGVRNVYQFSRTWSWLFFSSSTILFVPIMFESERHSMEEMHKMQQRQMLLGPNAAYSK